MNGGLAHLSADGRYRYRLYRRVGDLLSGDSTCIFFMFNPSTADASNDDPTLRKCINYARRLAATHLWVVNLFAYRSPHKSTLLEVDDPVGQLNDTEIAYLLATQPDALIICAWGEVPRPLRWRQAEVIGKHLHYRELYCLARTIDGFPSHPLYLKNDQPLSRYRP